MRVQNLERDAEQQAISLAAQPAAGVDWSATVPAGQWWSLLLVFGTYTSSVAVANRIPRLQFTDGTNVLWENGAYTSGAITAGLTAYRMSWAQQVQQLAGNNGSGFTTQLPLPKIWLPPGYVVACNTLSKDVADQWSAVRALILVCSAVAGD